VNPLHLQQVEMVAMVDQVVVDQELTIKLQLEDQELNLVNLVYQVHVVMETQVLEMLDPLDLLHVKLELVVEVELVQLHLIPLELPVLLVVLVKQVI
tara:strand:- start:407 stop:697 length:291 start_codon:yes stop_codon:yes gene_type:complete